ncbi:MAG TPA: BLUF domain-containing protein [Caldimonas sp.]|jgi:hypothetical protein|nr:BLUF domain-containing protein [Caldimonas sp.]HEX2541523.1 BLUF domain-containing protein [Caldimonas sp.]
MPDTSLSLLLYVSRLAAGAPTGAALDIARESRVNNSRDQITGVLTFDGTNFAQWVEGPSGAITDLYARLSTDTRHSDLDVIHWDAVASRRYPGWKLGFLRLDLAEFGIASLRGQRGTKGLEAFTFIVPALDIEPVATLDAPEPAA